MGRPKLVETPPPDEIDLEDVPPLEPDDIQDLYEPKDIDLESL